MKLHHHPNQIADDWLSLIKKSSFVKNMVVVLIFTMLQPWETSMHVALALIGGGMKHDDAVKIIGHKQHEAFNIKQFIYFEKYALKCVCPTKVSMANKTGVPDVIVLKVKLLK